MVTRRDVLILGAAVAAAWRAPSALSSEAPNDAAGLAALIRRKEISALEAVEQAIERIEHINPQLNFMVTKAYERARERARQGDLSGPFAGVPFLVKDLSDVAGLPTRSGSRSTLTEPAKTTQSAYVSALERAGLIIVGKSSTPEYGGSATTEPLAFEPTRNPWNLQHSAGGSSGGSAAAVAAGVVSIAHANDGGGSIRIPAANCGLVGLKPSRGRTISAGTPPTVRIALASDHCVCRSVRDSAILLAATEDRSASARFAPIGLVSAPGRRQLRIALVSINQWGIEPDADVHDGLIATGKLLAEMGHTVEPSKWPFPAPQFSEDFREYWITAAARIVRTFADAHNREPSAEDFEPVFLDMARSAMPPGERFEALLTRLHRHAQAYEAWFKSFDVILSPVLNRPPAPLGYLHGTLSWSQMKERMGNYVGYTPIQNVAGAPAISLPLHWSRSGLPIGMHFAGRAGDERTLLELAFELEQARPWHSKAPPHPA